MKTTPRICCPAQGLHAVWRKALLCLIFLLSAGGETAMADDVIRVTGKVVSADRKLPLYGVSVIDASTKRKIATTDEDGRFAVDTYANGTLRFTMVGAEPASVKVKGQTYIEVQMVSIDVSLGTAEAVAERIKDEVAVEKTTIEIRGNWMYIPIRVRLPREMFKKDRRLVVQPFLKNLTKKRTTAMRPLVYDAQEYNLTQNRMYGFDMDGAQGDPLAQYVIVRHDSLRDSRTRQDIFGHTDSVYSEDRRDSYSCEVHVAMENYNRIIYRDTSVVAQGTVDPLRWLEWTAEPVVFNNSAYYPQQEKQLRDSKGEINLQFMLGKAVLIDSPQNEEELAKLRESIYNVTQQKDASLQALSITGIASPEGSYKSNLKLANSRMAFAMDYMRAQLPDSVRRNAKFTQEASVASWKDVAALMRRDTLTDEASQVEQVVQRYGDRGAGAAMKRLPFYKSLLLDKYLPKLRRVDYRLNYAIFRQLTLEEIKQLYDKDYRQLSRFEFFQLYRNEANDSIREKYCRQALEMYPSFMVAANDLQVILIDKDQPEADLLTPFAGKDAPLEVNVNHVIALVKTGHYSAADTLLQYLPDDERSRTIKVVAQAYCGHYAEAFDEVSAMSRQNKVVMLLAMKRNKEALTACGELPDSLALTHYLKAIALNRTDDAVNAEIELRRSFRMDPTLFAKAREDGDVNTLLTDEEMAQ